MWNRDTTIRIAYNMPGHPCEYTLNIPGYGHDNYIPQAIADRLQLTLGAAFNVSNRGSRLEVTSLAFRGKSGDEWVNLIESSLVNCVEAVSGTRYPTARDLRSYVAPAPVLRTCDGHCDEQFTLRDLFLHRREYGLLKTT